MGRTNKRKLRSASDVRKPVATPKDVSPSDAASAGTVAAKRPKRSIKAIPKFNPALPKSDWPWEAPEPLKAEDPQTADRSTAPTLSQTAPDEPREAPIEIEQVVKKNEKLQPPRRDLSGVELRFVEAEGKWRAGLWKSELPPGHVDQDEYHIQYISVAFVGQDTGKIKPQRGLTMVLKALDEQGRIRAMLANPRPWTGGIYFFQDVELKKGSWTLCVEAYESSGFDLKKLKAHTRMLDACRHAVRVGPKRPDGARREDGEGNGAENDAENEEVVFEDCVVPQAPDGTGSSRRKATVPRRCCTAEDVEAAKELVAATDQLPPPPPAPRRIPLGAFGQPSQQHEDHATVLLRDPGAARVLKRWKAVPENRVWLPFESLCSGQSNTVFSRRSFCDSIVRFLDKQTPCTRRVSGQDAHVPIEGTVKVLKRRAIG